MGPRVAAAVQSHPTATLLRIDIKSWRSPVAKQYDIHSLPLVELYEGRKKIATGTGGSVLRKLRQLR